MDIAVPRDVEDSVDTLENVYLYNIDHLQEFVAGSHAARQDEIERATVLVDGAVAEFMRWQGSLDAAPVIVAVRERLEAVRAGEWRVCVRACRVCRHGMAGGGSGDAGHDGQGGAPGDCRPEAER